MASFAELIAETSEAVVCPIGRTLLVQERSFAGSPVGEGTTMTTRRSFLHGAAVLPLGTLLPLEDAGAPLRSITRQADTRQADRDYFKELGLGSFSAPNDDTIGRGMKVAKEELLGAMVALEATVAFDYESDIKKRREWVDAISREVDKVPGVETLVHYPKGDNHQPQLRITWDESRIRLTPAEAKQRLREGDSVVEVHSLDLTDGHLELTAWVLEVDEVEIVGRRVREVLEAAS